MTLLFADARFAEHDPGAGHPEQPARISRILQALEKSPLVARCTRGEVASIEPTLLAKHHDAQQLQLIHQLDAKGGGYIDPDTCLSPKSNEIAKLAAGTAVAAVDAVMKGEATNSLVLVRPPGHHATPRRSMGFCLYNNIALAALHARDAWKLERVLIVDWDVHHGNGTQDFFYADPAITFFSSHRYPFYPGTGKATEIGTGDGLGTTFNLPLDARTTPEQFIKAFTAKLADAATRSCPELILISAGFDAYRADPIGGLNLEVEHFAQVTQAVLDVAHTHADGRIVSLLEGGYNLDALPACVLAHLEELVDGGPSTKS